MQKILIIDRDQLFLSCLSDFLGFEFTIRTAGDEFEGIKLTQEFEPDLIICDLKLPYLEGYQVLKTLRENRSTAKIPFVFLSCCSEWEERDRALKLGANAYLSKPLRLRKLLATIEEQLATQELVCI
jgi:DNA-binding response OmpR family regulator